MTFLGAAIITFAYGAIGKAAGAGKTSELAPGQIVTWGNALI